jgi:N-methylhydantoinase A/oxoprolinase/acetone carboxylase beta subunit
VLTFHVVTRITNQEYFTLKNQATVHLIACGVLAQDIKRIAAQLNISLSMDFLPGGLHDRPEELRKRLQESIDTAAKEKSCDRIVVGYGICGRGSVGIKAPQVPLVFPRVHDCIALFLGSDQAYQKEFARYPGTYYMTRGWCREQGRPEVKGERNISIGTETLGCRELKDKYGEQGGNRIIDFFSSWHKNYQRAAFIDTGVGSTESDIKRAKELAREHNWKYERIEGDLALMTKLITQTFSDDEILVVPPGHYTIHSPFTGGLESAPRLETSIPKTSNTRYLVIDEEPEPAFSSRYGLGIDAGGTYTDAVIWDFKLQKILHKNKALTTKWDFSIGIDNALEGLDAELLSKVELVSVSTTLATNAIVEGEGQKTGLILMDNNLQTANDLISHTPRYTVKGYINISGEEIEPVDEAEVRSVVIRMVQRDGVAAFAVSGFAGSINPIHELTVKRIIEAETGLVVCCGHELSDLLNFVVRAQTALLNARIIPRMIKFFRELGQVLNRRHIAAPVMVVKGDGTLMSERMARERPVETTLSGPAASVAGAKLLTGLTDAMVVDIGGTTTDTADIRDDMVEVCKRGANVGGFITHVKALDMRTSGLGGDSLIQWKPGEKGFVIGPRRVGPLVWANHTAKGMDDALRYMEKRPLLHQAQVIFVAMDGKFAFQPTEQEIRVFELLRKRPHTPEELAEKLSITSSIFLPMARLEESGLVQRCGLTPTDLLHVKGEYVQWDAEPAYRILALLSSLTDKGIEELIDQLFGKIHRQLALELLKKRLFKDISEEEMSRSAVARQLIESLLISDDTVSAKKSGYRLKAELHLPVIGIGAPVQYFLPQAGKLLNAEVIIPPDADVANALGAITSHIRIRQQLVISPDSLGRFVVEGVAGNQVFKDLAEAEVWSVDYLKKSVRSRALLAGTTRKTVVMEIDDKVVNTENGLSLFLHRRLTATLQGRPDLVLAEEGMEAI